MVDDRLDAIAATFYASPKTRDDFMEALAAAALVPASPSITTDELTRIGELDVDPPPQHAPTNQKD